ncbi:MAG: reverse transcriptase domain-containing protein, partial [Burkholderiales bacterium]
MRRSTAVLCLLSSIVPYVINIFPLEAQIKNRRTTPARHNPFKLKVTFCVRGVISPLLANIYLHYVFDLWSHRWRRKKAKGVVSVVRYADDIVLGFQDERGARDYLGLLNQRLQAFGLATHPEKTRLIRFGRFAASQCRERGEGKPETFDFLGFTHYCTSCKRGDFKLGRKTSSKRLIKQIQAVK